MVEIKIKLKVSIQEFYEMLMELLKVDYKESTKRDLSCDQIKPGLNYNKKVVINNEVAIGKLRINELIENEYYQATFSVNGEETITEYRFIDAKSPLLVASKQFQSKSKGIKGIVERIKERRFLKKNLNQIQSIILNERGRI